MRARAKSVKIEGRNQNLLVVEVVTKPNWFERIFGMETKYNDVYFNTDNGKWDAYDCSKRAFREALRVYNNGGQI